jgi:site-specific recombinase XerD
VIPAATQEALQRFGIEYQMYHGLSPTRIRQQALTLMQYARFLGEVPITEAGADELRDWTHSLVGNELKPSTVGQYVKRVRAFYTWAKEARLIDANQLWEIREVRLPRNEPDYGRPRPYTQTELAQLRREIDAAFPYVDPKWWERYRKGQSRYRRVSSEVMRYMVEAIVALALQCGLRRMEIFTLEMDAMHPDNEGIVVLRKGGVTREVPYTEDARETIRRWFEVRSLINPPHDRPWIFAHRETRNWEAPLGFASYREILPSRLETRWEMHRLRHTCATNWLRSGMKLELVSELLGHSSLSQTLRYAKLVNSDIKRSIKANEARFLALIGEEREEDERRNAALAAVYQ